MAKKVKLQANATEKISADENSEISQLMQYLAPWLEKTDGEESMGSWETTMATKMMVKLLELWLTQESRERVEKMLEYRCSNIITLWIALQWRMHWWSM